MTSTMQTTTAVMQRPPPVTEARLFGGALSDAVWTFRGKRNRIFLLVAGGGRIRLGDSTATLGAPSIVWAPAGEAGSVVFEAGAEGAALAVPDVVLGSAMPASAIFADVRDAIAYPILGARLAPADTRRFWTSLQTIEQELKAHQPGTEEVIRHHLALLLIAIWRFTGSGGPRPQLSPRAIVRSFVHLVELHAREHWTIAQYAAALGVTTGSLNTAFRRAAGRTPMELIHQRLMTEAMTLLDASPLQVAEVATALGFTDAAYFSRFFKRIAGISPRAYRADAQRKRSALETNYAAWP